MMGAIPSTFRSVMLLHVPLAGISLIDFNILKVTFDSKTSKSRDIDPNAIIWYDWTHSLSSLITLLEELEMIDTLMEVSVSILV